MTSLQERTNPKLYKTRHPIGCLVSVYENKLRGSILFCRERYAFEVVDYDACFLEYIFHQLFVF